MCKSAYRSQFTHFLSGCSSACSGSVSITEVSFSFRFSSMLKAFSRSVFSFSSSSKAKGFLISSFAVSSCAIVSAFLVLAASSLTGSFDSSFSIRVRFSRASAPKSTLCFSAKVHTVMGVDGIIINLHSETSVAADFGRCGHRIILADCKKHFACVCLFGVGHAF